MSRPTKSRRICRIPDILAFEPMEQKKSQKEPVVLFLDEYEAIRLIDKEGCSQEKCSAQMGISRTTVQKIYESARQKMATVLVEGRPLRIEGGEYAFCDGSSLHCGSHGCGKDSGGRH